MAKLLKYSWSLVICMLLLIVLQADIAAECRVASTMENLHPKYLKMEKKTTAEEMGLKINKLQGAPRLENNGKNNNNNNGMVRTEDWELRRVPAGPDPLHHNGQNPNKPRTSP